MKKFILAISVLLFLGSPAVKADFKYSYVIEKIESSNQLDRLLYKQYIYGLGEGITWMDAKMKTDLGIRYYCPPQNIALNEENYLDIAKSFVKANPYAEQSPFGWLLITALKETFPCK